MTVYEESMAACQALFGKDCTFALATVQGGAPTQRVVDTYWTEGKFWIVTYATSRKVQAILKNPAVSLCNDFQTFTGRAQNMGHPLKPENSPIREQLIQAFAPWYFAHNNEGDENMCYVSVTPEHGFFHCQGTAYRVDFANQTAERFPFAPAIQLSPL